MQKKYLTKVNTHFSLENFGNLGIEGNLFNLIKKIYKKNLLVKDCFLTKNRNKAKTPALITLFNTVLEALVSATRQKGKKGNLFVQEEIKLSLFADE